MIKLVSKNIDIKIHPENPQYKLLSNFVGETFTVESDDYSIFVDEKELFPSVEEAVQEAQEFIEESRTQYTQQSVSTQFLKDEFYNCFDSDFLENTAVGNILNSHFIHHIASSAENTTLEIRYEHDDFVVYGKDDVYWVL